MPTRSFSRRSLSFMTLTLVLAACGQAPAPGPSGTPATSAAPGGVVPGRYVVVLKAKEKGGLSAQAVSPFAAQAVGALGGDLRRSFPALNMFSADLSEQAATELRKNPQVAYVELDRVIRLDPRERQSKRAFTPLAVQPGPPSWGLDRIDQRALPLDSQYISNSAGSGVNVYVIDTGIRATHQQFGGRVSLDYSAIDDGGGASDCYGHGTHVAGTVGASAYGVAKEVQLHSVRVLDCTGGGTLEGVVAGFDWVTANRRLPAVANASLGADAELYGAISDAAARTAGAGVTVVVAAGNDYGADACGSSPANASASSPVVTVGSTTSSDGRSDFSNIGPCVSLFAPGTGIVSTSNAGDTAAEIMDGTSMAAPHVAGAAALYLSAHRDASPAAVKQALLDSATPDVIQDPGAGSPSRLLYTPALDATLVQPPAKPENFSATALSGSAVSLTWSPVSGATGYVLERRAAADYVQITTTTDAGFVDSGLTAGTTYTYRVRAVNVAGPGPGAEASVTMPVPTVTAPAAPGNFSATAESRSEISLYWSTVEGATAYTLERRTTGAYVQIATPGDNSFFDTGLKGGTRYTYRLRAVNSAGASPAVEVSETTLRFNPGPCRVPDPSEQASPERPIDPC